jgi:hypothetical protein
VPELLAISMKPGGGRAGASCVVGAVDGAVDGAVVWAWVGFRRKEKGERRKRGSKCEMRNAKCEEGMRIKMVTTGGGIRRVGGR